jgi:hypothetical protein
MAGYAFPGCYPELSYQTPSAWERRRRPQLRFTSALVEQNLMLMSQVFSSRKMGTPCRSEAQASLVLKLRFTSTTPSLPVATQIAEFFQRKDVKVLE